MPSARRRRRPPAAAVVLALLALLALGSSGAARAAPSPWANVADPVFLRVDPQTLPHPAVYAVAQDARGFLWIGTPAGLARYDGYEMRGYLPGPRHADAPPGVFTLLAQGGTLWIGTPSNGLAALDTASERFRAWPVDAAGRKGPRSATVIAIDATSDGDLWIGGDAGLDRLDAGRGSFEPQPLVDGAQPRVEAVLVDRAQTVWVATVRGLFRRARGEQRFRRFALGALRDASERGFFSLYEDGAGRLWVGALNTVFVLDRERRLARTYASGTDATAIAGDALGPGEQWAIVEVTPGTFWVASYDGGISIVDDRSGRVRRMAIDRGNPGALTPGDVWHFFRDRSGLVWVANGPGGLLAHNPANRGIYSLSSRDHLGAGAIGARAVAATPDGALWLGGGDQVARLDPRTGATTSFAVPNHASVQTVHDDAQGTLWIGTMKGLCRLRAGAAAVACPPGTLAAMGRVFAVLDRGDTLWVGTGDGLVALDERSGATTRYRRDGTPSSLSSDFVTVVYADRAGAIWAGTSSGLDRIDPRTRRVRPFVHDAADPASLGAGAISAIAEDGRGRIWAGAVGGPLDVLTPRGDGGFTVRRVAAEGLPSNVEGLALGAGGRLWASANSVLASIDPDTLAVRLAGAAEGVQESEFWTRAVSRGDDGTLFFAGTYAVTIVTPDARADWSYAPPVVTTAVRAGGRTISAAALARGAPIELPAGSRDLSVEFAALDFSAPTALRYAYTLDGYRGGWVATDAAHRVATWTNLPPGRYTLRVRGSNRLGAWSGGTLALHVVALPAWYETWWFRGALALLLALGVVGLVRARTAVLRRRAERLEGIVAERTRELAQANAALEDLTVTDPLTGLRNRRYFLQRVDEDVALALRQRSDLVFFLVDVDHFKKVNDELGHAAGDRVLQQMRGRLEQVFRASDYVLRWGGEEFLAVARASRREDAAEVAERLRLAIAERPFELDGGQLLVKTASIGFAAFPFDPRAPAALSWEQVVELADQALYLAKRGGRNAWVGLAPSAATDARALALRLAEAPEEALDAAALEVVRSSPAVATVVARV